MFSKERENLFDNSQVKQRFSIKKFKFGAASVLVGLAFLGIGGQTVSADELLSTGAEVTQPVVAPTVEAQPVAETQPVVAPTVEAQPVAETQPVVVPTVEAQPVVETQPVVVPTVETQPVEATSASTNSTSVALRSVSPSDSAITKNIQPPFDITNAIYAPGVANQQQSYQGSSWMYRGGSLDYDTKEVPPQFKIYLQYLTGKGFLSPVYYTVSNPDGTFTFDLTKSVIDQNGESHSFQLAGDSNFAVRTWVENPDPTKYDVISHGDFMYGFHDRLNRKNESWDFAAGVNKIVNSHVIFEDKPLNSPDLIKSEAEWQESPNSDGVWPNEGLYGAVKGNVWYESGDGMGTLANQWIHDAKDVKATGVKVAGSYLNDDVTKLLDDWKKNNPNYTVADMRSAQGKIFADYQKTHGVGSHIAETVIATVANDGTYYLPFKGLYGVSAYNRGGGKSISDSEWHTLVSDADVSHNNLMAWNGTLGQRHRHINSDYLYVMPLVEDYPIWANGTASDIFEKGNNTLNSALASYNFNDYNFALLAAQPNHDVLIYDTMTKVAKPGDTVETRTTGLLPNTDYQVQWFKDGVAIGTPTTVTSDVNGVAKSVPITVDSNLDKASTYTSALFRVGDDTKKLYLALAADAFMAVPKTNADLYNPVASTVTKPFGTPTTQDDIAKAVTIPDYPADSTKQPVITVKSGQTLPDGQTPGETNVTAVVTYPDGSSEEVIVPVVVLPAVIEQTDPNTTTPEGYHRVILAPGPGVEVFPNKVLDVRDGTVIPSSYIPNTELKQGFENVIWSEDLSLPITHPSVIYAVATPISATPKDQTVKVGETPKAEDSIGNLPELPKGTQVAYETPVDTSTPGTKDAVVVVTYPDGSVDKVPVSITVVENPTQADMNTPVAQDQIVKVGETPKAEDSISNLPELPAGTKVEFETPIDTTTAGDKPGKVVVTYPDGSTDVVDVTVKVVDPSTDAEKYTPAGKDQTVNIGETPKAEDSISNLPELPAGTKVEFETPIDTTTAGDKPGKVVVT
ncbi:Rib/alpha-like domain-containing protein, partial [Streptococcus hongkongensis]